MIILLLVQIQFHFSIAVTLQALFHTDVPNMGTSRRIWFSVHQCFYSIPSYFDVLFIHTLINSVT